MCDRLGLGVLALGPAALFVVLVIVAITTIAGAVDAVAGAGFSQSRRDACSHGTPLLSI
jgi:hypothetical protein